MRNWLVQIRKTLGMTQDDVAKKAGIARSYYTRIENGKYHVPVDTAKKISQALNIGWTDFYSEGAKKAAANQ